MAKASISKAWDDSRGIFARDGKLFFSIASALVLFPTVVFAMLYPGASQKSAGGLVAQLIVIVLSLVAQIAIARLAIGPSTTVGAAIGHGARRAPILLGAALLVIIGLMLLFIPIAMVMTAMGTPVPNEGEAPTGPVVLLALIFVVGLFLLWAKLMLTTPVTAAERAGPIGIIKRSWTLSNGHFARLFGLAVLFFVMAVVLMGAAGAVGGTIGALISPGLEPLSLGTLVMGLIVGIAQCIFVAVTSVMLARVYVQLAGPEHSAASVPDTPG